MAVGRRDYTWGFLNEAASEGRYTESFLRFSSFFVNPGDTVVIFSYTVPAGCRIALNRISISTETRFVNWFALYIGSAGVFLVHFSDNHCFDFSDKNPFYVAAGNVINIWAGNNDTVVSLFYFTLIGAKELII